MLHGNRLFQCLSNSTVAAITPKTHRIKRILQKKSKFRIVYNQCNLFILYHITIKVVINFQIRNFYDSYSESTMIVHYSVSEYCYEISSVSSQQYELVPMLQSSSNLSCINMLDYLGPNCY